MKKNVFYFFVALFLLLIVSNSTFGATKLSTKMKGKILLQVEDKGQAWYVIPGDEKRVFLGRPADAFQVMKKYGLGVSNENYDKMNKSRREARKFTGRILIKVEDHGKAYYINPRDNKLYYLGTPSDAFLLMRTLGLGITNENLNQIETVDQSSNTQNPVTFLDSDGDGIGDDFENQIDTDPNSADTDEDGYDDYVEIANGYNPLGDGKLPKDFNMDIVNTIKSYYSSNDMEYSDEGAALASEIENIRTSFTSFPDYSSSYSISAKEKHLADLINDYREVKKLERLPVSRKLSFTGKVHLMDLTKNRPDKIKTCDRNSWSNQGQWEECCHSGRIKDTNACMMSKPEELTNYTGLAYENVHWVKIDYTLTPELAFNKIKRTNLIIDKGLAKDFGTSALGVALFGNWAAVWVGNIDDSDNIEGFSDCSIISDKYLANECNYDNSSYLNDEDYCAQSSDSAYQEDCEIRSDLYQCNGLRGKDKKDCQMAGAAENKRVCNYIYTKAKQISSCYYYNDYAEKDTNKSLILKKGRNDIYFRNSVHQTIAEFASLSENITEIKTTQNGQYVHYNPGIISSSTLSGNEKFEPYRGYSIIASKRVKITYNREIDLPKQDIAKQITLGTNLLGFSDNVTAFKYQLDGICKNYTVSQINHYEKSRNISTNRKPLRNKTYEITCADTDTNPETNTETTNDNEKAESIQNKTTKCVDTNNDGICFNLLNPKSGEIATAGKPYEFKWVQSGHSGNLSMSYRYYSSSKKWYTIETNTSINPDQAEGSFIWNVPPDMPNIKNFYIQIGTQAGGDYMPISIQGGKQNTDFMLVLNRHITSVSFPGFLMGTIGDFIVNNPIVTKISTETNGVEYVYDTNNPVAKSLDPESDFIPYQGYTIFTNGSVQLERAVFFSYKDEATQNLETQIRDGINYIGFQDVNTTFSSQLINSCPSGMVIRTYSNYYPEHKYVVSLTNKPALNVGYWVECSHNPFSLKTGWNIVSVEKKMTNTIEQIVQENPEITVIRSFDESGAHTYDPSKPAFFNDLQYNEPFLPYAGYQIKVSNDIAIPLKYTDAMYDQRVDDLRDGWNLIGFKDTTNSFQNQLANVCPAGITVKTYDPGSSTNDENTDYKIYDSNNPVSLNQISKPEKNVGYWVGCIKQTSGTIPLNEGWNLISVKKNISESLATLAPASGNILAIRSFDETGAHTFDPKLPQFFNDLDSTITFQPYSGYWIKASSTQNLKVTYTSGILDQNLATQLNEGWNLIGFKNSYPFVDLLAPVCSQFIVKGYSPHTTNSTDQDSSDLVYDSENSSEYNNIVQAVDGMGYWVKCVGKK